MEKKKTAIQLLREDIDTELKYGTKMVVNWDMYLETEKEQIVEAHLQGLYSAIKMKGEKQSEEYYNETYK
jgi:hypothetical protein